MAYGTINAEQLTTQSGYTLGAGNASSFKNRILNGSMVIDQRNAGASVTPAASTITYTLDRWLQYQTAASKFSVQRNAGSVTTPSGFTNYLGITSLSSYSSVASDAFLNSQYIEGFNTADFAWGTANAQAVTISFWVRSSLTGTFSVSVCNDVSNRNYIATYTVSAANTWEYKTITIPGDTSGTWLTSNGLGLQLRFDLGSGSNFNGTAGSWGTSNLLRTSGSQSIVGTNGATFYITGVQLEVGTVATSFDYRSYGTELALCQRYYTALPAGTQYMGAHAFSTNRVISAAFFPVTMRATPTTASATTAYVYFINGGAFTSSAVGSAANSTGTLSIDITVAATSGGNGVIAITSPITISAEL